MGSSGTGSFTDYPGPTRGQKQEGASGGEGEATAPDGGEGADDGGLARTVRAEQTQHGAGGDFEIHTIHGAELAELLD